MNISLLKEKARKNLKGNYGTVILAMLIYSLLTGGCLFTNRLLQYTTVGNVLQLILTGLLGMGLIEIIVKVARKKKTSVSDLFNRTDLFIKTLGIAIMFYFMTTVCTLLETVATHSLCVFVFYQNDLNVVASALMIILGVLLCVAIAVFFIALSIYFSQVLFILYDEEKLSLVEIFNKSIDIMSGHVLDYIILSLSFIGWIILGIFTFGILYLWLFPYMAVTYVNFYDKAKADYKKSLKK